MNQGPTPLPAVLVDRVSKEFRLPHEQVHTLKERALHPFRRASEDTLGALRDVSFAVKPGEFFGIVGRNGSGKSTLLKCLAGIYRPNAGEIYIRGRVSTFIELGVGFNPDLAARDNIVVNAIMLGLSPSEARKRVDEVIAFAELEEFVDLKLKNYSSGMQVRLAFSVMAQVDADVLLIDEVLAVGDAAFQQKCFDVFHRLQDEGKTILFVTHDMGAVKRFCDRALLIERGEVRLIGAPDEVGDQYVELNFGRDQITSGLGVQGRHARLGDQSAQIVDAWFEDSEGRRSGNLPQGKTCRFCARVRAVDRVEINMAVLLDNEQRQPLFATSSEDAGLPGTLLEPGTEHLFSVEFELLLASGRIYASPWMVHDGGTNLIDRRPRMASLIVTGTRGGGGALDIPHRVSLRPATDEIPV